MKTIEIPGKVAVRHGKTIIYEAMDSLWHRSKSFGKKLKTDFLVKNKKGVLQDIFFNKNGETYIMATLTLKELEDFIKNAKSRIAEFDKDARYFIHLNPEISFLIKGGTAKKKTRQKSK